MPKKTTKTKSIRVKTKKQGYWINKENKKPNEQILESKEDKTLVKRLRSGYNYDRITKGINLSRTDLQEDFSKLPKKRKQTDLLRYAENTKTAPVFTAKGFFDFSKGDVKGIDTPINLSSKELKKLIMSYENSQLALITVSNNIVDGEKRKDAKKWVLGEKSKRRKILSDIREEEFELNRIDTNIVKETKKKLSKMDNLTKEDIKEKKKLDKEINAIYHDSDNLAIYENKLQEASFMMKKALLYHDSLVKDESQDKNIKLQAYHNIFSRTPDYIHKLSRLSENLTSMEKWIQGEIKKPTISKEIYGGYENNKKILTYEHKTYRDNINLDTLTASEKKIVLKKIALAKKQIDVELSNQRKVFELTKSEKESGKDFNKILEDNYKPKDNIASLDRIYEKITAAFTSFKKPIHTELNRLHNEIDSDYPAYDKVLQLEKEKQHKKTLAKEAKKTKAPPDKKPKKKVDPIIEDFSFDKLPKDYHPGIREASSKLPKSNISDQEKKKLLKLFKIPEIKQNKQAIMFLPIDYLTNLKGNVYRSGDDEFYIKRFNEAKEKTELPFFDIYTNQAEKNNKISEGNHRILALKKLGYKFAPVRVHYNY